MTVILDDRTTRACGHMVGALRAAKLQLAVVGDLAPLSCLDSGTRLTEKYLRLGRDAMQNIDMHVGLLAAMAGGPVATRSMWRTAAPDRWDDDALFAEFHLHYGFGDIEQWKFTAGPLAVTAMPEYRYPHHGDDLNFIAYGADIPILDASTMTATEIDALCASINIGEIFHAGNVAKWISCELDAHFAVLHDSLPHAAMGYFRAATRLVNGLFWLGHSLTFASYWLSGVRWARSYLDDITTARAMVDKYYWGSSDEYGLAKADTMIPTITTAALVR